MVEGEYRIFVNILEHSRINWQIITRTDFHIRYSLIFVYSKNLEVPRTYSTHNDEYQEWTNTLIRALLVRFVRLFSPNVLGCSSRINICVVPPIYMSVAIPSESEELVFALLYAHCTQLQQKSTKWILYCHVKLSVNRALERHFQYSAIGVFLVA